MVTPTLLQADFSGVRPEALFARSDGRVQVLSDDGEEKFGGKDKACKDLKSAKHKFRSIVITP